jgi:hypothetical protein
VNAKDHDAEAWLAIEYQDEADADNGEVAIEELLFVRALDDIGEMHIRTLGNLANGARLTAADIAAADPGLANGVVALLNQLQSHGLTDARSPVTPGGAMTPEPSYFITNAGREFLERLRDDQELVVN